MADTIRVLQIVDGDRYEVNDNGWKWKPGQKKRKGAIPEVRIKTAGLSWGAGYRAMLQKAGKANAAAVFGVFVKLLEVAACQTLEFRWLVLYSRNTQATYSHAGLADAIGFSEKDVAKALEVLTSPEVAWIRVTEVEVSSRDSQNFQESPENLNATQCIGITDLPCVSKKKNCQPKNGDEVQAVIDHYRTLHPRAHPGEKEAGLITARLKEGYDVAALVGAIDGNHRDDHCCGRSPDGRGKKYHSLELIVRDSTHVARYLEVPSAEEQAESIAAQQRAGADGSINDLFSTRGGCDDT